MSPVWRVMAQWERERAETRPANSLLSAGKLLPEPPYGDTGVLSARVAPGPVTRNVWGRHSTRRQAADCFMLMFGQLSLQSSSSFSINYYPIPDVNKIPQRKIPFTLISNVSVPCQFRISAVSVPYQCRPCTVRHRNTVTCILNRAIHTHPAHWTDSTDTELTRNWRVTDNSKSTLRDIPPH
jgi:hypothetical protein